VRLPELNTKNILIGTGVLAVLTAVVFASRSGEARVIALATGFIGVKEGSDMVKLFTDGRTEAWCADFVSYVLKKAGLATKSIPSVRTIYDRAKALGVLSDKPSIGAVFLQINTGHDLDGVDKGYNHTGFVIAGLPDGRMTTIEGNYSDQVASAKRRRNEIQGYVALKDVAKVFA
jgi:hypothetical protein